MDNSKPFSELVDYVHPSLSGLDYSKFSVKLTVLTAALLTTALIYVTTHVTFVLTSQVYRNLRSKEKVFWNLAVVRGCYGTFCIVVGAWAWIGHTGLEEDVVWATTSTSHLVICVTVGFFVFECSALTVSDICFRSFSHLLHLHHWISLVGFTIALVTDASHNMACKALTVEMSTPFSCLCWTLLKAGKEQSFLWKGNQFLLVHTFHLRNVVEMGLWWLTYCHWEKIWMEMPVPLMVTIYLQLLLITLFLTPYWTWKKTMQMFCPVDWNFDSAAVSKRNVVLYGRGINGGKAQQECSSYGNGHSQINREKDGVKEE